MGDDCLESLFDSLGEALLKTKIGQTVVELVRKFLEIDGLKSEARGIYGKKFSTEKGVFSLFGWVKTFLGG